MANEWDGKLKGFLKRAGEDFKRAGNDIKEEAQRLMKEVKDPQGQEKIKEGLKDFGVWAKKAAVEMADLAETGFKKAEGAFRQAAESWTPPATPTPSGEAPGSDRAEKTAPASTPPSGPPEMDQPAPAAPKKTIGKKKPATAGSKPKTAKKTIGKKQG